MRTRAPRDSQGRRAGGPSSAPAAGASRASAWVARLSAAFVLMGAASPHAAAQDQIRNFTKPILVLNPGGHHSAVHALLFPGRDGSRLLSAGVDKVVHEWVVAADGPGIARTIRPPIWRGFAGGIYAAALSPRADERGQRHLAVAGFGVEANRGNIVIYSYPGPAESTGDVVGHIYGGNPNAPEVQGHLNAVTGLAFSPDGSLLASASLDGTVRLWDPSTRRHVSELVDPDHPREPIRALGFTVGGQGLIAAGDDGSVRLWDVARARVQAAGLRPSVRSPDQPPRVGIRALAIAPAGDWVVVGRADGSLIRLDARNLGQAARLPSDPTRGAVLAIALGPDGRQLAASVLAFRDNPGPERPRVDSVVERRSFPAGDLVERDLFRSNDLVRSLAFSPDGRSLAFAGDDFQSIYIKDLAAPDADPVALRGNGHTIHDVGFSADSLAVGYSRVRPDRPDAPADYFRFHLIDRTFGAIGRDQLRRDVPALGDWSARPDSRDTIELLRGGAPVHRLTLDRVKDVRWWCYSFLPPNAEAGHPRPVFAIGCETGVALYDVETGRPTRYLAGHNGPILALAPSPDGKWLVTGSSDQTIRLWSLKGCDTPAPFGATLRARGDGSIAVDGVERLGHAEAMGLREGDVIEEAYLGADRVASAAFLEQLPGIGPDRGITLVVSGRRDEPGAGPGDAPVGRVNLYTSRREVPALNFFPGLDDEWVLWTPQGYYDTSIRGDDRHLGWHLNRSTIFQPRPTGFVGIREYEAELRRRDVIDRLLRTGDLGQALADAARPGLPAAPEDLVEATAPPRLEVRVAGRPAEAVDGQFATRPAIGLAPDPATGAVPAIRVTAEAEERSSGTVSLALLRDGMVVARRVFEQATRRAEAEFDPGRGGGLHTFSLLAVNADGKSRAIRITGDLGPDPAPPEQRLVVLTVGVGEFPAAKAAAIPFAERDAESVARFLADSLIGLGGAPLRAREEDVRAVVGASATRDGIAEAFASLGREPLGPGDIVAVLLESHLLRFDGAGLLLGHDAGAGAPPSPAVPAAEISDVLGRLAQSGCTVLLLVDVVHPGGADPAAGAGDVDDWVRDLCFRRGVITFVASQNRRPSRRLTAGRGGRRVEHGAFAYGVLSSLGPESRTLYRHSPDVPYSLYDFGEAVRRLVEQTTSRRQQARLFRPDSAIPDSTPLLDPRAGRGRAGLDGQVIDSPAPSEAGPD